MQPNNRMIYVEWASIEPKFIPGIGEVFFGDRFELPIALASEYADSGLVDFVMHQEEV